MTKSASADSTTDSTTATVANVPTADRYESNLGVRKSPLGTTKKNATIVMCFDCDTSGNSA